MKGNLSSLEKVKLILSDWPLAWLKWCSNASSISVIAILHPVVRHMNNGIGDRPLPISRTLSLSDRWDKALIHSHGYSHDLLGRISPKRLISLFIVWKSMDWSSATDAIWASFISPVPNGYFFPRSRKQD